MIACLDLHDFSVVNNRLDLLKKLKEYWPEFKVSLFTVPIDDARDLGPVLIREGYLKEVKECLDWIQIIPHGLMHHGSEMKYVNYQAFRNITVSEIDKAFTADGLPYEKGFCAPHWRWSDDVVRALDDMGWWGAVDRRQPNMACPKRFYRYSHCLDEEMPFEGTAKLHGHVYGTSNDLGLCFDNLMRLPKDTEWRFVTDFIEEK